MPKPLEEILTPRPEARPRIYAYSIADEAHGGLLKVGQTTRNVQQRIAEQLKTATIKNPNGDNPNEEEILKPVCFVFDFAPTRALRQLSEYGIGLRQMARDLGMSASWLLGVESGQNGIDAVRLADVGRYLGFPASYFLDDPDFVQERQRQLMSRPATRLDWKSLGPKRRFGPGVPRDVGVGPRLNQTF